VGTSVGENIGLADNDHDGIVDGNNEADEEGYSVGFISGNRIVGSDDVVTVNGFEDGASVGAWVGCSLRYAGYDVDRCDGVMVGIDDDCVVGDSVGDSDGD